MAIDAPLTVERTAGQAPGVLVLRLAGPLTLANLFSYLDAFHSAGLPSLTILDLSGVPYMDSAGMGAVINHFVHCQNAGVRLVAAGVSPRVLELFRMTKVESVIPMAATAEEAEAGAS